MDIKLLKYIEMENKKLSNLNKVVNDNLKSFNDLFSDPIIKEFEEKVEKIIGKKLEDIADENEEEEIIKKLPQDIAKQYELIQKIMMAGLMIGQPTLDYITVRSEYIMYELTAKK